MTPRGLIVAVSALAVLAVAGIAMIAAAFLGGGEDKSRTQAMAPSPTATAAPATVTPSPEPRAPKPPTPTTIGAGPKPTFTPTVPATPTPREPTPGPADGTSPGPSPTRSPAQTLPTSTPTRSPDETLLDIAVIGLSAVGGDERLAVTVRNNSPVPARQVQARLIVYRSDSSSPLSVTIQQLNVEPQGAATLEPGVAAVRGLSLRVALELVGVTDGNPANNVLESKIP